ncbi:hypothetical protein C3477_10195 [Mycobacterium kansasii]|uniref:DUF1622 domain-containing protein n=1 Tax=Mycobacterium kansasii TaxID=1768 RepID=UPI000CDD2AB6|nr:DUF1622 domain-containing protein [Mycobacterium kansasii]POX91053.1 hypothetical protein C3B43_04735 [Mycobacterium kansasii]POY06571.1 hypothetical protein C3477_10195 [Mycobacterium kansasii]POY23212.1 hypothetical protein C3476_08700 [Mycobacterium kansasii]
MSFIETVVRVGMAIDGLGVAVIIIGAVGAIVLFLCRAPRNAGLAYREFRVQLGRSILVGLELLVAGDIIKTIALKPNAQSVAALAGIVAIRTFLSFSLTVEMTGRWPWQQNHTTAAPPGEPIKDT